MKKDFDFETIANSGHDKAKRDLKTCRNANVAFSVAVAKKICEISYSLKSFIEHRIPHLSGGIIDAEDEDQALFRQTLILNLAMQSLIIEAVRENSDFLDTLMLQATSRYKQPLGNVEDLHLIKKRLKRAPHTISAIADTFNGQTSELVQIYMHTLNGFPSPAVQNVLTSFPHDDEHQQLAADINKMFHSFTLETLERLAP